MARTKKAMSAGRYGARYGTKVRQRIIGVESGKGSYSCPRCLKPGVKRISAGIWECRKCGLKFAGKAYKPQ
jgi:large subunit ribosomal protein L37Ae